MYGLLLLSLASTAAMAQEATFVVSGYNSEAGLYSFTDGVLAEVGRQSVDPNLTWMEQDPDTGSVYATHEVGDFDGVTGGVVSRWEVDQGSLVKKEYVSLESVYPAHLLLDREHGLAYTANYGAGTVSVVSLTPEGQLDSLVQTEAYGEGCRDDSHPHQVVRKGDLVWIVDLGCDAIHHYRVVDGMLESIGETAVEAGAGPRHMVLHPTENLAFLACELKSIVEMYAVDLESGELTLLQQLQFSTEETNAGAEILMSEDGNYVYASSRRVGVVVVYKVVDNTLERIQEYFLQGTWPRSMVLKGNYLVTVHKIESIVEVLSVDPATGMLAPTDAEPLATPNEPAFIMELQM